MARPLLSLNVNSPFCGQQNETSWQSNLAPPWQQKNNAPTGSLFPIPPVLNSGILGASPNFQAPNRPVQQQSASILGQKPIQPVSNILLQNKIPPWQQTHKNNPPSLLDLPDRNPKKNNLLLYRNQTPSHNRNNGKQDQKSHDGGNPTPAPMVGSPIQKEELERQALEEKFSDEFFDEVKSRVNVGQAIKYANQFARTEYNKSKGLNSPPEKAIGSGNHTCSSCMINFVNRALLNQHYKSPMHKEVETLCILRREQAKLIFDGKLKKPKSFNALESIKKAELEMSLKPEEMDLDPYILGIYESIMRPYWPVPKNQFYCRICNYMEFVTQRELERHNLSRDHTRNEENYAEAFCLYCQVHNIRRDLMIKHERTEKHKETKELMEETKEAAIKHWHKANNLELPETMKTNKEEDTKPGDKRSVPQDSTDTSPAKRLATGVVKQEDFVDSTVGHADFGQTKISSKSINDTALELTDKNKMWFAPITGYMCVACHTYVTDEKAQVEHLKEGLHVANVAKFKKMVPFVKTSFLGSRLVSKMECIQVGSQFDLSRPLTRLATDTLMPP